MACGATVVNDKRKLLAGDRFGKKCSPGLKTTPFSIDSSSNWLALIPSGNVTQIKDAVRSLEHIQARDLMTLLARVRSG